MSMTQLAALLIVALLNPAIAGTMFRLEVGPPIAAGTGMNFKNLKSKIVLVVRPRVCEHTAGVLITGTAEGLVNGVRQSIALDLISVNAAEGIRAIQQQWPENGQWVLQLNGSCPNPKAFATTLVPLSKSGFIREKMQVLTEPATHQQLEAALAALVRSRH